MIDANIEVRKNQTWLKCKQINQCARQRKSNIRSHTKRGHFCLIIKFLPHQVMCEPIQKCWPIHVNKKLQFGQVFKHSYIIQVTGLFFFFEPRKNKE